MLRLSAAATEPAEPLVVVCHNLAGEEVGSFELSSEEVHFKVLHEKVAALIYGNVKLLLPSGEAVPRSDEEGQSLRGLLCASRT